MSTVELPIPQPQIFPYGPMPEATGNTDGDTEMRQQARAWINWRVQTGQINHLTAREQRYVINHFVQAMGNRPPKQVGETDLERWRASMTGHLSPATIRLR